MSRRNDALIPLTHDHHHTLAQARRLKDASKLDDATERRNAANDFLNFYFGRVIRHFHEEEELFFAPLIDDARARELVLRAVSDHLRVHALARGVKRGLTAGEVDAQDTTKISNLLTDHVRFEEQQLFPLVEEILSEEDLQDLATSGRRDV